MNNKIKSAPDQITNTIKLLLVSGMTTKEIAKSLKINEEELLIKYKDVINTALSNAKKLVVKCFFDSIEKGNVAAQIFFLKARCGWDDGTNLQNANIDRPVISVPEKKTVTEWNQTNDNVIVVHKK